jgi:hypothetical protein
MSGGLVPVEGDKKGCRRVNMVEYYVLMYENGKMRHVGTIPKMGGGEIKKNNAGVNSATIYYKNFHKCYNVLPQK